MSFSNQFETFRIGTSCGLRMQTEMTAQEEEATGEVETGIIEGNEENNITFSPDLVNERIKASPGPLHD